MTNETEMVIGPRERFQKWVLSKEHPVYGWLDGHWLQRGDDREGYANEYVQGLWVAFKAFVAPAEDVRVMVDEPVAVIDEGDDGLFAEFIYGDDGSPLKRGDKLYLNPADKGYVSKLAYQAMQHEVERLSARREMVMPDNLESHRGTWIQALERLVELEPESFAPDQDEKCFWRHELKAMRDMYARLDELRRLNPCSPS